MSDVVYNEVELDEIIDFSQSKTNGSFFTKTLINNFKGLIPVYGASKDENEVGYGYVVDNLEIQDKRGKKVKVKYFEDCLTWNIDGSAAIFYREGKFSLSEKVIPLIPFDGVRESVDLDYIKICIENSKEMNNFSFSNKAGKSKLKEIKIRIPVNELGYDLKLQKEFVKKYKALMGTQSKLEGYKTTLENALVEADFTNEYKHIELKINQLFTPMSGGMQYTKTFCNKNKGEYPIYSGNTKSEFASINNYDYDGKYLTWSIDGLAGYIKVLDGKFSITNHRGILIPKEEVDFTLLDIEYLKYIIEPIFRKHIKGRMGHDGQNEYTSLKLNAVNKIEQKILVPVNDNGDFDLEAQREIAEKFKKINKVKNGVCEKIGSILEKKIAIFE
ncbi:MULTISPECIES: restriction endonuclease subunit S [unclassified Lysinibacillus]|uniref:restriction endonuclease subunit S n=1 Tax=unclassified Lysinibacillus TaxID=2636778 RepID=UPI00380CE11D